MAILKGVKDRIDVKITAILEVDNGADVVVPFVVTYKKPTVSEVKALQKRLTPDRFPGEQIAPVTDEELAKEYILGWAEVPTTTGEPLPFTPENLAEMLEVREYVAALVRGMNEVIYGRKAVEQKNS